MNTQTNISSDIKKTRKPFSFYDSYDYATFWRGRDYEHSADVIAVTSLLRRTSSARHRVIDIGGGMGRMTQYYADAYEEAIIMDSSLDQLEKAKSMYGERYPHILFKEGIAQQLPFPNEYADLLLCIRVSHYIKNIKAVIFESERVLVPGGYFILEIANKIHMKARWRAWLNVIKKRELFSESPSWVYAKHNSIVFVNHHPHIVEKEIYEAGFSIVSKRSVSNFRSPLLKKIIPTSVLLLLERITQPLFASWFFGPSIYFLLKKKDT